MGNNWRCLCNSVCWYKFVSDDVKKASQSTARENFVGGPKSESEQSRKPAEGVYCFGHNKKTCFLFRESLPRPFHMVAVISSIPSLLSLSGHESFR